MNDLEINVPDLKHKEKLRSFFELLSSSGDVRFFHPHEFTEEAVNRICQHKGQDYYCLMIRFDEIVGYGMLRGWDEGYEIPSLGIAVSPNPTLPRP